MSPTISVRWAGPLKALLLGALVALAGPPETASAQILLDGGVEGIVLQGNDFQCGLRSDAGTCAALDDSPTDPGGVWPTGSPNAYMFNSGIMVATIIDPEAGFAWAGDTVGAYFFSASGPSIAAPVTNIWNSQNPVDLANWPQAGDIPEFPFLSAFIDREDLFDDVLIGRRAASQQDTWLVYWDGDPTREANRPHPAGLLIEQRTMAWNYPAGNEGTLYFVYEITNVSDNEYFQDLQRANYPGLELPEEGWTLENVFMSYAADPDVTANAAENFASAILPADMGIVWKSDFVAPEFQYPPSIFHSPFYTNAPGIIGTKYLQSPLDLGLTLFSVYTNPSAGNFNDPSGSAQLWRYLSGNIRADLGDDPCTITNPQERRLCYFNPSEQDVRYFQSSGPFSIEPGQTVTVVSAMFAAATVAGPNSVQRGVDNPETVSTEPNASPSVHPSCHGDPVTPILVASGWVNLPAELCPPEGDPVDLFDIEVIQESLLHKAQVAQTIFDNQFLLPFAPEAPEFYVVPGDGQVTVVWEPTTTEELGDPFALVATDPESPLFNPNFREFDVEGYRIYRSTDASNFDLVAQFDKAGTFFVDFTCETDPTFVPGAECDMDEDPERVPLSGRLVQYPPGGIVELADGSLVVMQADTAPGSGFPALGDTGVPFVFVDNTVRNGFEYFYRVTAFDINSLAGGPTSLESTSRPAKQATPQPAAAGFVGADSVQAAVSVVLGDGTVLDPTDDQTIDPTTGIFSGPPPPTDAIGGFFEAVVPQLLAASGEPVIAMTLDSVVPTYLYTGTFYFSDQQGGIYTVGPVTPANASDSPEDPAGPAPLAADPAKRDSLEALGVDAPPIAGQVFVDVHFPNTQQWHSADADWAYTQANFWTHPPPDPGALAGGSRWFEGDNEVLPNPTLGLGHGSLGGVTVFLPVPYQEVLDGGDEACTTTGDHFRRFYQSTMPARRVADMEVRWDAGGVSEVFDVTHQLPVPFEPAVRASYGFLTDANGDGVLTFADFYFIPGLEAAANIGDCAASNPTPLVDQPMVMDVDVTGDQAADGTGFGMYIAGEPYLFELEADALPTSGTWTLRTHSGVVTNGSGQYVHLQPSNEPEGVDLFRIPGVPGLRIAASVTRAETFFPGLIDLADVRVSPDPYYGASLYDFSPAARSIRFMNLPAHATIRIYSVSGVLVDVINHNSNTGESLTSWDLRNRSGQMVASGVYFYHVTTPNGEEHTGKFTVIHSGLSR